MDTSDIKLLDGLEILQLSGSQVSPSCVWAVDFLGKLAANCGAKVLVSADFPWNPDSSNGRGKQLWENAREPDPLAWASADKNRLLLIASDGNEFGEILSSESASAVEITMEPWQSESTLLAQCALADLLGDPERAPLVPAGHYAAASIGYAAFTALCGVYASIRRQGRPETARVNGLAALGWLNWKAAAAGYMGKDIHREGHRAEWPVLPCRDGHVAFVFTERDWDAMLDMINDEALRDERFASFQGRQENRDDYMSIVRPWAASKSKAELTDLFQEFAIPGAPVATPGDLLQDPLLLHRQAFQAIDGNKSTPVAPHRIEQVTPSPEPAESESSASETGKLPLAGMRILDLGIITAGAGSTGLLADLGAEVLKIESHTYPDPFRHWAGSSDSPLFNFNNRNKYGVAIDLKTEAGKAQFLSLVKTADAVVENFRRGVLDRMGLGFDVLKAANPNILLLSISGQGSSGPGVGHTTFGSTLEASSGFAANTCYDDGLPWITGRNVNYPDQTVCFYAAAIAGLAMTHCRETNQALQIDVSQRDVAVYILGEVFEHVSSGGTDSVEETRRLTADYTFEGIYPCQDGRWVALATSKTEALTEITGLQGQLTHESLAGWAGARDADEAANQLLDNGIGAAKVLHGSEMYKHPVVEGHGTFTLCPGGTLVKGFPFELQHCEMTIWGDAPQVGEHSSKFLKEE